jgi:4-hydroxybenzoate polyprenyltransferase
VLSGGTALFAICIGVAIACLVTAATNIVNAYADRKEDAVNQPARAFWLDQVGDGGVRATAIFCYCSALALSVFLSPLFVAILLLGIFNSVFYSAHPLRFKTHPFTALFSFSAALALPFLGGVSINQTPTLWNPMLWLVTYFMFTYGTVKNLPDFAGDKKAGVKTSATIFKNIGDAVAFTGILLFTPYILLVSLVGVGLLNPIYLVSLAMLPMLAFVFQRMRGARNSEQLEHAHTLGYFYAISFVLVTLILSTTTMTAVAVVAVAYVWALLVSRSRLHSRVEKRDWENQTHTTRTHPVHDHKVRGS